MNRRLHFFGANFSIYFSWIFINLGLNANKVTFIFFITGALGSVLFAVNDISFSILAYALWRLHIIFDICDGEVARFDQKFSINGAYWDYMIHSVLYPVTYISIMFSLYTKFGDLLFLYLGLIGSVIISQTLSVKNNYYRAMLFNRKKLDNDQSSNKRSSFWSYAVIIFTSLIGFEGFLFFYVASLFVNFGMSFYLIMTIFYLLSLFSQSLLKFVFFSRNGYYQRKT